ncbi:MAG: hypothetical protein ACOY3O_03195 [Thermodesulfobacteriota bacterium]
MTVDPTIAAHNIVFGLNREEDERSLAAFLQLFSRPAFTEVLIPRLDDDEIQGLVHLLTALMRNHLSEREYHEIFLADPDHHH